jgi:hypothetical protein
MGIETEVYATCDLCGKTEKLELLDISGDKEAMLLMKTGSGILRYKRGEGPNVVAMSVNEDRIVMCPSCHNLFKDWLSEVRVV